MGWERGMGKGMVGGEGVVDMGVNLEMVQGLDTVMGMEGGWEGLYERYNKKED